MVSAEPCIILAGRKRRGPGSTPSYLSNQPSRLSPLKPAELWTPTAVSGNANAPAYSGLMGTYNPLFSPFFCFSKCTLAVTACSEPYLSRPAPRRQVIGAYSSPTWGSGGAELHTRVYLQGFPGGGALAFPACTHP
jgi:hypothetical protein